MICELRTVSYPLVDPRRRYLTANFALGYRASKSSKELSNIDLGGLIDERQKTNAINRKKRRSKIFKDGKN